MLGFLPFALRSMVAVLMLYVMVLRMDVSMMLAKDL